MPEISYIDFDPNDDDHGDEWTEVSIGKSDEKMVSLAMEYQPDTGYVITAMSNERNIYKSTDQGVTWEFDRQAGHLEYWLMRARDKWSDLRIVAKWPVNKIKLWWLRRKAT